MIFNVNLFFIIADGVQLFFYQDLNLLLFVVCVLLFADVFQFAFLNFFGMFYLLLLVHVNLVLLYQKLILDHQKFIFSKMLNSWI